MCHRTRLLPRIAGPRGLLVPLVLMAAACAPGEPRGPGAGGAGTPVILISVDTLRADHLPAYGYRDVQTPAIDALATDGIVYENAHSHAPTTLPSHASILTGVPPTEHGARDNAGFALDPATRTLAELLADAGYRTGGFVSAFPLRPETGIAAGFGTFDAELTSGDGSTPGGSERSGQATLRRALAWLREPGDAPVFLFLHLYEPHRPYSAPPDIASRFALPYDAEIAEADRIVGSLLAELRARGLYDEALILFLSDHGEGLGDHGELEHGIFVYAATLHVPLLVKLPGSERAGTRIAAPVQLIDVLPTILQVAGRGVPEGLHGRSLLSIDGATRVPSIYSESYAPRLRFGWSELLSLIEYPLHYIEAPEPELYDMAADPAEQRNLFGDRPDDVRRMGARLRTLVRAPAQPTAISAEARDKLAALGYLGGGGLAEGDGPRADPKSKLGVLRDLDAGAEAFFAGHFEEAIAGYDAVLRADPGIPAAWELLGRAQLALGRLDDASSSLEMVVALGAADDTLHLRLSEMYLRLQRFDDAAQAAERALEGEPARARVLLARAELARERPAEAQALLEHALQEDPDERVAHTLLAEILAQPDPPRALEHADRALALAGDTAAAMGLRVLRARALAALDRQEEAANALADEIRLFPADLQAYRLLALHHAAGGRASAAIEVLESMVRANPGPIAERWAIDTLRQAGLIEAADRWRARAAQRYPNERGFTGQR